MNKIIKQNHYKTKSMLNNYLILKSEIKDLNLENEMLKNNYDVKALEYQESTGKTYKINSIIENTAINNEQKIKENNLKINLNQYYIDRIDNALTILDNKFEREVIENKFLLSMTNSWKDVSYLLSSPICTCRNASTNAIEKLSKFLFK